MSRRLLKVFVVLGCALIPATAAAQSAIAGVARDATGGVLPGVTVEVSSPVLIEKTRSAITDQAGQYRVVDLRPGTYAVTFTLQGFNTVRREGIVLDANFTAPVNVEMRVGAITETVTVTGESPIVDVQNTMRRETVNRELLDTIPTGRDFQTIGNVLPGVTMGRFDVGGSSTAQSGTLVAFGSRGADFQLKIDGMHANNSFGEGWFNGIYHNEAIFQEMSYTVSGGNAENQAAGVSVNMIPRTGSNIFAYEFLSTYANDSFQGANIDDALRLRGFNPAAGGLAKLWDVNGNAGGPLVRDKLWFFGSGRYWGFAENVPNVFWGQSDPRVTPLNADQASDDTNLKSGDVRLTTQLRNTRLTGAYSNGPRWRRHFGIENRGGAPESFAQYPNEASVTQFKATSTLSSKMLLEAGFSRIWWYAVLEAQPNTRQATCFVAFASCPAGTDYGDIRKRDLTLAWNYNAPTTFNSTFASPRNSYMASLSYVTGGHNMKIGLMWDTGYRTIVTPMNNGGLQQQYRLGVADSVVLQTVPSVQDTSIDREIGAYVQDSWTFGRLTLNPGLRLEHIKGSVRDQTAPAGRFLPERTFTQADYVKVPSFTDVSPRFGVAYDLFGNGKTALKGNFGKYVQSFSSNLGDDYNPMGGGTDTRTWRDLNTDDIAQENELGPSQNLNFGKPANVTRPDADLTRPYQLLYSAGVQQELLPGLSGSINYYYREYYRDFWVDNALTTHADYSVIPIADPRGNSQTISIYSIAPGKLGVIDNVRMNSTENGRVYHGIDFSLNARFKRGMQLQGGVTNGKLHEYTCQVDDPNRLRYCDAHYPFVSHYKLSGTYPLPLGFRLSGVFQSVPGTQSARDGGNVGKDLSIAYSVGRAIAPGLTQATVNVQPLNEPGTVYLDRVNQLDFAVSRDFRRGRFMVRPQFDFFNALNTNAITQVNQSYGTPAQMQQAFGPEVFQPQSILNPRLIRFNVRVSY
jgi:hypothetical protein